MLNPLGRSVQSHEQLINRPWDSYRMDVGEDDQINSYKSEKTLPINPTANNV
jgi:hypothetical protein